MGFGEDLARALIRFSLGRENTPQDVDSAVEVLRAVYKPRMSARQPSEKM
jgi:cysteine sulfinate desulfinase/cysteine desulfurase-like protein